MDKLKMLSLFFFVLILLTFAYILSGLFIPFKVQNEAFSLLSIELVLFAFVQAMYEIKVKNALLYFLISYLLGFIFEILGTNFGFPFGKYSYSELLGPKILGVPIAVPFVWFFITYLCFSITKRTNNKFIGFLIASLGAMNWDIFIDPMFVSYGYWSWSSDYFPSLYGVPITNFLGWYLVSFIILYFFYIAAKKNLTSTRDNSKLSYFIYLTLITDGILANFKLNHFFVMYFGIILGAIFLAFSFYVSKFKNI